ncbi:MAG: amidohydrolase family protein [Actinobacteria bacterium]|nr:amidohydrolase family protein [Actinomycetota bacterium]
MTHDLIVRGGTVLDGTGAPPRAADVAVTGGVISAVGEVVGTAHRVVDADGALVTPGFVDIHTHYDGMVTWSPQLTPTSWHGVTTAVMGNCGVGFAPVRPADHATLIELMEGVEDIPGTALHEGIQWEWESFPEYLDAVGRRRFDLDVGVLVPHAPLRLYVMGERGAEREPATPDDVARMGELLADGLRAGALGFSTSRTINHRASTGELTPSLSAERDELVGLAQAMGTTGRGYIELISDFEDLAPEFETFRRMAATGRPVHVSLNQRAVVPGQWREELALIAAAADEGLPMCAQVAVRGIGILMGLQATLHPLLANPVYQAEVSQLDHDAKVAALRDPDRRARILQAGAADSFMADRYDRLFPLGDPPDYEPPPDDSVASRAAREERSPAELTYDLLLQDDGRELLYFPVFNYADATLDDQRELLLHPDTVVGLSDGGAHVGTICDASFPTTLIGFWGRDRSRGPRIDLPWLVKAHTLDTAASVGLHDRGVLAPGYCADLNVIDLDRLAPRRPEMVFDLPAGGKRLVQRADGYKVTIVGGTVTYAQGEHTGELPGRLVRGGRQRPVGGPDVRPSMRWLAARAESR